MEKIGKSLGISKQAVSQAYSVTKVGIIDLVLKRMEYVLTNYLRK
jgi:predicted transcriptional regulator